MVVRAIAKCVNCVCAHLTTAATHTERHTYMCVHVCSHTHTRMSSLSGILTCVAVDVLFVDWKGGVEVEEVAKYGAGILPGVLGEHVQAVLTPAGKRAESHDYHVTTTFY